MIYSEFIFAQLFIETIEEAKETEYDILHGEIERHHNLYEWSAFNTNDKGEYQCMTEYLSHYKEEINNQLKTKN